MFFDFGGSFFVSSCQPRLFHIIENGTTFKMTLSHFSTSSASFHLFRISGALFVVCTVAGCGEVSLRH